MQPTRISWADWTYNPIRGCSRISPGCVNCYAELDMARKNTNPKVPGCHGYAEFRIIGGQREAHWTGKVDLVESKLLEPLSWRKKALRFAQEHGRKPRVFVNSMSDLFHERLPDEAIDRVFAVMALCPEMTFLVLTKRADRMEHYQISRSKSIRFWERASRSFGYTFIFRDLDGYDSSTCPFPLTNVWLGVSVEDQKRADERIPHLRRTPAAVRFLSVEPMLEEIWIGNHLNCPFCADPQGVAGKPCLCGSLVDWVICGGESGAGARPFDLKWARSLRDQCKAAGVAFFMKQFGSNAISSPTASVGSQVTHFGEFGAGRVHYKDKKGGDPAEWPADVRIEEVPECR